MTELIRHIEGELGKVTDPIYREALGLVLGKMRQTGSSEPRCESCLYYRQQECTQLPRIASIAMPCAYWENRAIGLDVIAY